MLPDCPSRGRESLPTLLQINKGHTASVQQFLTISWCIGTAGDEPPKTAAGFRLAGAAELAGMVAFGKSLTLLLVVLVTDIMEQNLGSTQIKKKNQNNFNRKLVGN